MNAPLNVALLQLSAAAAPVAEQPQVAAGLALLLAGHQFKGLHLDLYGHADEDDGCEVVAVALSGTQVDIAPLLTLAQLSVMGWAVDKVGIEARAASGKEGRAERAAWDRAATA
ncbi:hypothetical protein D0T23_05000 [Duganella sp. BJB475]|nr:hypothetical protein D0T23_05000 [Duganella sp. BJB475]